MLDFKDKILIELQDVLRIKNFSQTVKTTIRTLFLEILGLDIEDKENHIKSIIEGIKKFDTFEMDTREELLKIESIKKDLSPTTFGFVSLPRKIIVIVKSEQEQLDLYHELIHTTQTKFSYNVDTKYGFSITIQKAMKEGEAINREMVLTKKKFPNTYKMSGSRLVFSCHSELYRIYLEFYQDMQNIFGKDLIEEWKQLKSEEDDIMPKLENYAKSQYHCSISSIFNLWGSLLYHAILKYGKKQDINKAESDLANRKYCYANNKVLFDETYIEEIEISNKIIDINKNISKLDNILNDDDLLNREFSLIIETEKRELEEYIMDYGNDDVSKEWKEDIENVNLEDYKLSIINEKDNLHNYYSNGISRLNKILKIKQNLERLDNFYLPTTEIDFTTLSILKERELSKIIYEDAASIKNDDVTSSFILSLENSKQDSPTVKNR